jgi:hypothetical protein
VPARACRTETAASHLGQPQNEELLGMIAWNFLTFATAPAQLVERLPLFFRKARD